MHLLIDILRNAILITGLVVVMMMMIESLNIESRGLLLKGLKKTRFGQILTGALLGSIPGCMGGFAVVSLYTHRFLSFGALVAMMIASSGDESFVMLAMVPHDALMIFVILFVLAIVVGILVDSFGKKFSFGQKHECTEGYAVHNHTECHSEHPLCHSEPVEESDDAARPKDHSRRHLGWRRISMFVGLALFIAALAGGQLGHDHSAHADASTPHEMTEEHEHHTSHHSEHVQCHAEHEHCHHDHTVGAFNLLDEQWMNILFAGLSVLVLIVLIFASDHFVEEHLWKHIVKRHLPVIFAWTFGTLLVLGLALQHLDIESWISSNTALMILLATLIGIIPESGPHMIFVTLFATGVVPFPVLLASSISQDGHAALPLLAESRKSFFWAKIINCAVALAAGYAAMLIY